MEQLGRPVIWAGLFAALAALLLWPYSAYSQRPPEPRPATIFAVGDIMHCNSPGGADQTGRLMERLLNTTPDSIGITLGDNSNDDGSEASYDCFNRSSWGKLMDRVFPTPGNHDYGVDGELPFYFLYFPRAGEPRHGYYAFNVGGWRIYALNSELLIPELRRAQLHWLERDLASNRSACTLAYFHRPPFSSGRFASPAWVMPIFRKLYKYGVDLVITGHEHFFASIPPMNPDGVSDLTYGIPTLIAGTGGAVFFDRPRTLRYEKWGEKVMTRTLGVAKVTLHRSSYQWEFLPVDDAIKGPAGTGQCHENPPGYKE